jgi:hypothetical protein
MRQIAYPAALGSCVLGAGGVRAAEWSITPLYSSSVDYDSNRILQAEGKSSGATTLAVDLRLKRALEDLTFIVEPHYALRRFTDSSLGNGDDRSVSVGMNWIRERSTLNLTASYFDQSTLVTEVLETGIVSGDTHRRLVQAGAGWNWSQTERRALIVQVNYLDVDYHGRSSSQLAGYRYPSGSIGEQLTFSERGSLTLSAFGSRLESGTQGNSSSLEEGLQVGMTYLWSEQTSIDASLGKSRRVLTGQSSTGTDASIALDHSLSFGKLSFSYKRSLVPYGVGFLVEQQQFVGTFSRSWSPYLDSSVSFYRIEKSENAVLLNLDRRNYDSLAARLNWHPAQTWSVGATLEGVRTHTADLAGEVVQKWRSSVSFTWSPFPKSRSW